MGKKEENIVLARMWRNWNPADWRWGCKMVHHKGQRFYDLIYVKSSEQSNSKRNKVALWLPGAGDKGSGELVFDGTAVQDEESSGNWLHSNVKIVTNNEPCAWKIIKMVNFMLCAFSTVLKNLMWNKNGTWCASFGNLPVLESRLCHFLVIWPWTTHITCQYWPQKSGKKTWREQLPGMLRGSVMLWTGQVLPNKEQPPPQSAPVIPWGPQ